MSIAPFPHFATDAIHAGQPPDARTGAVIVPISLATTFYQESPGKMQTVTTQHLFFFKIPIKFKGSKWIRIR